jgi:hypothetical protein
VPKVSEGKYGYRTQDMQTKKSVIVTCYIYTQNTKLGGRGVKNCKAIPVTGRGGSQGCERLRLPHFLDNRLTVGGKVVSLTRQPSFTPQEDSWYSIVLEAE